MKSAVLALAVTGLASAASAQTAEVVLTGSATTVSAGESFTITATAFGDMQVFGYNLLVDVTEGLGAVASVSNLVYNPTGSTSFFGAPAGEGLGAGTGFGVDARDATAGILIAPLPLDGLPLFSFTVTPSALFGSPGNSTITFSASTGSGNTAAVTYPDTSVPPIVLGRDYADIVFGSISYSIPAPAGAACLGFGAMLVSRRRRS